MVNVIFGANGPKLIKTIEHELKQEQLVQKGEMARMAIPFEELCGEEKERAIEAERLRIEEERLEAERKIAELEQNRLKLYTEIAENLLYETVVICLPHTNDLEKTCAMFAELDQIWFCNRMYVSNQRKIKITPEMASEIFYRNSIDMSDDLKEDLASGVSTALLVKCHIIPNIDEEGEKKLGDIEKLVCEAVNKVELEEEQELVVPHPESIPYKYRWAKKIKQLDTDVEVQTEVPGCWTPASFLTKGAAYKSLFPLPDKEDDLTSAPLRGFLSQL